MECLEAIIFQITLNLQVLSLFRTADTAVAVWLIDQLAASLKLFLMVSDQSVGIPFFQISGYVRPAQQSLA